MEFTPGKLGSTVFILIVGAIFFFGSFHIVPPGHRGIRVTLGKTSPTALTEGLTLKMPLITKIYDIPIKQITTEGTADCFSSDLQLVKIRFNVLYVIPEQSVVTLFQAYSGNPYQTLIEPRVQENLKQITANHRAEDLVKTRDKIKGEIVTRIRGAVGDILVIRDVVVNNIDLSNDLEHAIEQKVVMEQQALTKNFELHKAQKEAEITLVNAEAEAKSVKIKGEALKVASQVIDLEIVKKWNGVAPVSVVTTHGGANILLPLK